MTVLYMGKIQLPPRENRDYQFKIGEIFMTTK